MEFAKRGRVRTEPNTMNRIIGAVAALVWIGLMAALLDRDYPFWRQLDPPSTVIPTGNRQTAIYDAGNNRVGTAWMTVSQKSAVVSFTQFEIARVVPGLPAGGPIAVKTTLGFDDDGSLQRIMFWLHGVGIPIQVSANRIGDDFACDLRIGDLQRSMSLPAEASECLGESLRPFTHLKGLHVGQTWRIRIVDPIALLRDQSVDFTAQMATVTARENVKHNGVDVPCFKIETNGAIAWANDEGTVVRQEVVIPFIGKWTLLDEKYDAAAREKAMARVGLTREAMRELPP